MSAYVGCTWEYVGAETQVVGTGNSVMLILSFHNLWVLGFELGYSGL